MAPRDSIVCAVDGGPASVHIARVAAGVARVLDAPLNLVHVVGAMPDKRVEAGARALWPASSQPAIHAGCRAGSPPTRRARSS